MEWYSVNVFENAHLLNKTKINLWKFLQFNTTHVPNFHIAIANIWIWSKRWLLKCKTSIKAYIHLCGRQAKSIFHTLTRTQNHSLTYYIEPLANIYPFKRADEVDGIHALFLSLFSFGIGGTHSSEPRVDKRRKKRRRCAAQYRNQSIKLGSKLPGRSPTRSGCPVFSNR